MGLYTLNNQSYLIVSNQGNNQFLGVLNICMNWNKHLDGVSEAACLAVIISSLGSQFASGLPVVQDGRNILPKAP